MDSIIYTNSGAPLITPWSARGMSNEKYAALAKADEKKRTIESEAMKAFDAPQMKAAEQTKARVRERIEGIRKRLLILKKLYSMNPKEMAKALAQVFKELKAAVKEYKKAMEGEIGAADAAVTAMESAPAAAPVTEDDQTQKDGESGDAGADSETGSTRETVDAQGTGTEAADNAQKDETTTAGGAVDASASAQASTAGSDDRHALYGQIEQKVREMAAQDGMTFMKEVRSLVQYIEDRMLTPARIQMKAKKPEKETDKAFEEVEKELKDLKKDMEDMERDIKREVPTLGMHVNIAA